MVAGHAEQTHGRTRTRLVSGAVAAVCVFAIFLLMAHDGQLPHAVLLGLLLMLGAIFGLLGALGLLESSAGARNLAETTLWPLPGESPWAAPYRTVPLAIVLVLAGGLVFGQPGMPIAI